MELDSEHPANIAPSVKTFPVASAPAFAPEAARPEAAAKLAPHSVRLVHHLAPPYGADALSVVSFVDAVLRHAK